jgi:hypothetical protein
LIVVRASRLPHLIVVQASRLPAFNCGTGLPPAAFKKPLSPTPISFILHHLNPAYDSTH